MAASKPAPPAAAPRVIPAPSKPVGSLLPPSRDAQPATTTSPSGNVSNPPSPASKLGFFDPRTGELFDPAIRPAMMQQAPMDRQPAAAGSGEENIDQQIQLKPPGMERLFRLESEAALQERMRQEALQRTSPERITFPDEPILTTQAYQKRDFPPLAEIVEPHYTCFGRLFFEQKNFERGGWDLGFITPFLCAGTFFWDVATLPYHIGTEPCRRFDCSSGQCLPGDPTPFILYPPQLSVTGALLEAGTIIGIAAVFPG